MSETIRAFIAAGLSEQAKAVLARAIWEMEGRGLTGVRWVKPDGMHLTLKFLGDITSEMAERVIGALRLACSETRPFALALSRTGAFPSLSSPRVLWVGLTGDLEPLGALQERIELGLERLGFEREGRGFSPHVTLGRVREGVRPEERRRIAEVLAHVSVSGVAPWRVASVDLMRSTLTAAGAVYDRLAEVRLT